MISILYIKNTTFSGIYPHFCFDFGEKTTSVGFVSFMYSQIGYLINQLLEKKYIEKHAKRLKSYSTENKSCQSFGFSDHLLMYTPKTSGGL